MTVPLSLYRFSVPEGVWRRFPEPNPANLEVSDANAIVIAASFETALQLASDAIGDWVQVAKRHSYRLDRVFSALPATPREQYLVSPVVSGLTVYKFILPGVAVACAVARSPAEARRLIEAAAELEGSDVTWIAAAVPTEFPVDVPAFVTGHIG